MEPGTGLLIVIGATAGYVFTACVYLLAYHFLGYPVVLYGLARLRPAEPGWDELAASVSIIVPAHNEADSIARKVENLSELTYAGEVECILVDDGSTDGTAAVVARCLGNNMQLIDYPNRRGKSYALNVGVERASGDIVVCTDVGSTICPDALPAIVGPLADPSVGCVTGHFNYVGNGESQQSLYWRYESWLRHLESKLGSTVVVNGAIMAVRRADWEPLPEMSFTDDLTIALIQARRGRRIAYASEARAFAPHQGDLWDEYRRRVRIGVGNFQTMIWFPELIDPRRGVIALEFVSHKVLRWGMPALLGVLLVTTAMLSLRHASVPLQVFLGLQLAGYLLAVVGAISPRARRLRLVGVPTFFVVMNAAFVVAFVRFLRGPSLATWR